MTLVINGVKVEDETKFEYVSNPKRAGFNAHARYEEYSFAQTLVEYLEISDPKFAKADLRYDHEKGHLEFVESSAEDE